MKRIVLGKGKLWTQDHSNGGGQLVGILKGNSVIDWSSQVEGLLYRIGDAGTPVRLVVELLGKVPQHRSTRKQFDE